MNTWLVRCVLVAAATTVCSLVKPRETRYSHRMHYNPDKVLWSTQNLHTEGQTFHVFSILCAFTRFRISGHQCWQWTHATTGHSIGPKPLFLKEVSFKLLKSKY